MGQVPPPLHSWSSIHANASRWPNKSRHAHSSPTELCKTYTLKSHFCKGGREEVNVSAISPQYIKSIALPFSEAGNNLSSYNFFIFAQKTTALSYDHPLSSRVKKITGTGFLPVISWLHLRLPSYTSIRQSRVNISI